VAATISVALQAAVSEYSAKSSTQTSETLNAGSSASKQQVPILNHFQRELQSIRSMLFVAKRLPNLFKMDEYEQQIIGLLNDVISKGAAQQVGGIALVDIGWGLDNKEKGKKPNESSMDESSVWELPVPFLQQDLTILMVALLTSLPTVEDGLKTVQVFVMARVVQVLWQVSEMKRMVQPQAMTKDGLTVDTQADCSMEVDTANKSTTMPILDTAQILSFGKSIGLCVDSEAKQSDFICARSGLDLDAYTTTLVMPIMQAALLILQLLYPETDLGQSITLADIVNGAYGELWDLLRMPRLKDLERVRFERTLHRMLKLVLCPE
jgi:hypothetical protein